MIIYYAVIAIFFVIAIDVIISNIAIATAIATIDTIIGGLLNSIPSFNTTHPTFSRDTLMRLNLRVRKDLPRWSDLV
ncbi:MAG: hypothetical protein GY938_11090 [Ketobacter sp.]|nr:hypothetical protein [Ketobacter sp.]